MKVLEEVDELQGVPEPPPEGELSSEFPLLELRPHGRVVYVRPTLLYVSRMYATPQAAARAGRGDSKVPRTYKRGKQTPRDFQGMCCETATEKGQKQTDKRIHKMW